MAKTKFNPDDYKVEPYEEGTNCVYCPLLFVSFPPARCYKLLEILAVKNRLEADELCNTHLITLKP